MFPLRRLLACASVALVATTAFGAAATLGLASDTLAAGSDAVGDCDNGVIAVDYTGDPGPVTGLTVSGVDAPCGLGRLSATVTSASGASLGSGTAQVPAGGGSVSVTFASVDPALIARYVVTIVTP